MRNASFIEWITEGVADTHKLSSNFAVVDAALNKNVDQNLVVGSSLAG